ncbi:MAG: hypothetical protein Ct9H300mP1_13010 [Planctomycetaceae bacterium]|nr:MAG: hypothetical protein Ct9H300mP1_13010 [Planctomycetaceae bacterium]
MPLLEWPCTPRAFKLLRANGRQPRHWLSSMQHVAWKAAALSCLLQFVRRQDFPTFLTAVLATTEPSSAGGSASSTHWDKCSRPKLQRVRVFSRQAWTWMSRSRKYDFDVSGHYARPDVFRLSVNESPTPSVGTNGSPFEISSSDTGDHTSTSPPITATDSGRPQSQTRQGFFGAGLLKEEFPKLRPTHSPPKFMVAVFPLAAALSFAFGDHLDGDDPLTHSIGRGLC